MAMKIAHLALEKDPNEAGNIPEAQDAKGDRPVAERGKDAEGGEEHDYPAGMGMHMSHEELGKMGHDEPPPHGAHVHFEGHGRVTHVSDHPMEKGGHMVHVQITHMGMEHGGEGEAKSSAEKLYGKAKPYAGKETAAEERAEAQTGKY